VTTQPPIIPGPDQPQRLSDVMPAQQRPSFWRTNLGQVVLAGGVLIAFGIVVMVGLSAFGAVVDDEDQAPVAAAATSADCPRYAVDASTGAVKCAGADAPAVVNEQPKYAAPTAADFKIGVKILERKCFGSAGCNVTFRITPDYTGAALDPSITWLVTYEVHGVEDGPQINSFEVTGDEASFESEERAQTKSSKTKLTVKVTDVTRN
jgi:hypothetical protein